MYKWKLQAGSFLFKYRSLTPVPLIIVIFIFFKPVDLGKNIFTIHLSGLVISLFGQIIRIVTVVHSSFGTSGRESYLRADSLNVTGIYSIVRNPLYIGNFFILNGLLVFYSNVLAILIFDIFFVIQYYFIIISEEKFLKDKYEESYDQYCKDVVRIFPVFKNYKKSDLKFNFKKLIFREKDSIFNMFIMFVLIMIYKEKIIKGSIGDSIYIYISLGIILIFSYLIVNILKKRNKN